METPYRLALLVQIELFNNRVSCDKARYGFNAFDNLAEYIDT